MWRQGLELIGLGLISIPATGEGTVFVAFTLMGVAVIVEYFKEVKYGK